MSHISESELSSVGEVMEARTWNRQRTIEELTAFVRRRDAQLEGVDLGI